MSPTTPRPADELRRLFVAIDPPGYAVDHLGSVVDGLAVSRASGPGHSTRLAARDRWHVTLAFLGDVPTRRIARAESALRAAAGAHTALPVHFAGGGTFGRGAFTILWAGLDGDLVGLRALASTIRNELRKARLPFDPKGFRPHLTLSRPGRRVPADAIAADVATLTRYLGPQWTITQVYLVESHLGPHPTHTHLATAHLLPSP